VGQGPDYRTGEEGEPLDPDVVSRAFRRAVKHSGLPHTRLHDLRHADATLLHEAGVPEAQISRRLGHSNLTTTRNVYTHWRQEKDRESANVIQAALLPTTEKAD
jgi:integrase